MSAARNRNHVREFYRAMNQRSNGAEVDLGQFFTENVSWQLPRSSPLRGCLEGRAAVVELFNGPVDDYYKPGSSAFDHHHQIADADFVVMQFTMSAITVNGHDYENDYCMLFRLEGGLIAEVREFFDTAHLFSMINPD